MSFSVLEPPFPVLERPFSVLEHPFSVLEILFQLCPVLFEGMGQLSKSRTVPSRVLDFDRLSWPIPSLG
jgi:hypothetical protein